MLNYVLMVLFTDYLFNMACDTPFYIINKGQQIPVPCGRCPQCKRRRVSQWVFRLLQEELVSISSFFVTLTYDTEYLPLNDRGFPTLIKSDFQKFMKRLRRAHVVGHKPIKYYACGEYGSKNRRPHYHAILFNSDLDKIHDAWPFGSVHVGDVSNNSIAYVAKYIQKGTNKAPFPGAIPEFSLMSKGLGKNYINPQTEKYHKDDLSRNFVTTFGSFRVAMPRYYRDRILSDREKEEQQSIIFESMIEQEVLSRNVFYKKWPDGDYEAYKYENAMNRYRKFVQLNKNRTL